MLALVAVANSIGAQRPVFEPPPDKFDWVQLKSGEWLKGEFTSMYSRDVEFDSDELDELKLDWGDVARIRTEQIVEVRLAGDRTHRGKLVLEGKKARLLGDETITFPRSDIIAVSPGAKSELGYWSGKVSAGVTIREGNTDRAEANLQLTLKRRSSLNRVVLDYLGIYDVDDGDSVANNHRATANWNRFLTNRFYVIPASVEYFRDPFQNVSQRWTGAIDFTFQHTMNFTEKDAGRYSHHMITTLETEITSSIDFDVSFVWDRLQEPQRDSRGNVPEQDDFRVIFALGANF